MTDRDLAAALIQAKDLEAGARQYWAKCQQRQDLAEADAALNLTRHVTAVRKALETWISTRAVRESRRFVS